MNTKKPKVRLWSVLTALTAILTIAGIGGLFYVYACCFP